MSVHAATAPGTMCSSGFQPLCDTFQDLARETWHRLEEAEQTGLRWSEETNTETLLMRLRERHPAEIRLKSFTRMQEASNGADWEWWFGVPGHWYGMRVQAKRLKLPEERFDRLQSYKSASQARPQIDMLISTARAENLTPIYCLYAYSRKLAIPDVSEAESEAIMKLYGCVVGHAEIIRNVGKNTLEALIPWLSPWHRLVCVCMARGRNTGSVLGSLFETWASRTLPSDLRSFVAKPRERLPKYLEDQGVFNSEDMGGTERLFHRSRAAKRGIKGILIVEARGE